MSFDIQINNPSGDFGLGNHDIVLDANGSTITLTGKDKLIQDVLKILFTNINVFYSEYETKLASLIGTNLGVQGTINILAQRIGDSLAYLMSLQAGQVKYQQCQGAELIQNVLQLNIDYLYELTLLDADTRTFRVSVVLQNKDYETITVAKDVTAV